MPSKLDWHVDSFRSDWNGKDDPSSTFSELEDALTEYKKHFSAEPTIVDALDGALSRIETEVEEMEAERPREPDLDDDYKSHTDHDFSDERSVFDDVDHE